MKIAICISGQLRQYKKCASTFYEKVVQDTDADIFVHTWSYTGGQAGKKPVSEKEIRDVYNPRSLVIEDDFSTPTELGTMYPMWYKVYQADLLRRNHQKSTGTKYDFIVRCRSDLWFRNDAIIDYSSFTKNTLYFGPGYYIETTSGKPHRAWDTHGFRVKNFRSFFNKDELNNMKTKPKKPPLDAPKMNDQFAIGSPKVMDIYANTFLFVEDWLNDPTRGIASFPFKSTPGRRAVSPQDLYKYYMWIYNIPVVELSSVKYMILR